MKNTTILFFVFMIVLLSGCVEDKPQNSVIIDNVEYSFVNDIKEASKVPVYYPKPIREKVLGSKNINIVFDCSHSEDRPIFSVVAFNAVTIIQTYFVYSQEKIGNFSTYCYIGDQWYNSINQPISSVPKPDLTLKFVGPFSGANETSVLFSYNNTIIIQGSSHSNVTLATDAFSLTVLGVKV